MIKSFSLKNFYSFRDEVKINLNTINNKDVYKNVFLIYGHNAAGKTNLLKFFSFFPWLSTSSWKSLDIDTKIPFDQYEFCKNKNDVSSFEIIFSTLKNSKTYKYVLKIDKEKILLEQLWIQKKGKRTTFFTLFKREWNKKRKKYHFNSRNFPISENIVSDIIQKRKNSSVLSILNFMGHKKSSPIIDALANIETNVGPIGRMSSNQIKDISQASEFYNNNEKVKNKVMDLIKFLDIGLSFKDWEKIYKPEDKERYILLPAFDHYKKNGDNYPLSFLYESSGTKNLYVILRWIVEVLLSGGIAVLDEIDADLHPLVVKKIINYFVNPKNNPYNAQLIISTHSTEIMNLLSKSNIFLVEKNKNLESSVFNLANVEGVRNTENFAKKYLSGNYGGVMSDD